MTKSRDEGITTAFSAVLKQLRQAHGLSQEELALISGIDRTSVSRLEAGSRQPSLSLIFSIAQAVDQTPQKVVAMVHREWSKTHSSEAGGE
ncbi:hypothetical protein RD110_01165 [Rhodoferax koreense]|uniref:HTH cro/C1-type domain-containing protein n=1 Tax=Rhodoferax koreensis TaxID=1842727 RepID=A0A1P8JQH8_9BURK|nr:helix-turn-helix transcriptional regulator [Rhodoferax koreense]APW35988.1 hypothetical protein RD110_01165 [Rhodoferax koreense]